jgi:hypothetical protein
MPLPKRRPELAEIFEREIFGRIPAAAPKVTWAVQTVDRWYPSHPLIIAAVRHHGLTRT